MQKGHFSFCAVQQGLSIVDIQATVSRMQFTFYSFSTLLMEIS